MKSLRILFSAFSIVFIVLILSHNSFGQCNPNNYAEQCIPKLANGFNFLKSYPIDGKGGTKKMIEYSYVFTKGTQYMINVCADGGSTDGIVVNIFDSNRNQIASSKVDGEYISSIAFPCSTTGIYYIQYAFDNSNKFCGGSALGFKR